MTQREFSKAYNKLKKDYHLKGKMRDPRTFKPESFSGKSANGVTKLIVAYAQYISWLNNPEYLEGNFRAVAWRVNNTGVYREGIGWTKGGGRDGQADISFIFRPVGLEFGIPVYIEVKYGKDTQKKAQKSFQNDVSNAGAIYIIVKTFEDFLDQFNDLFGDMIKSNGILIHKTPSRI